MKKYSDCPNNNFNASIKRDYRIRIPLPRGLAENAMPMDFGCVYGEVTTCQKSAALFDYSFLLRALIKGPDAVQGVSEICGRDFSDLRVGGIRYGLLTDRDGWLISDLTIWRSKIDHLEVIAGGVGDLADIKKALIGYNLTIVDLSEDTAVFSVQGPKTNLVLSKIAENINMSKIPYFSFRDINLAGAACRVGRLGYTGLDGVEILCAVEDAARLWELLSERITPAGFSAANYLRLKAGLPLFTNEFKPLVSAADIGLRRVRPQGNLPADCRAPRASRICFSARFGSSSGGSKKTISSLLWTPEDEFPPEPGRLAVTSIIEDLISDKHIGMGYVAFSQIGKPKLSPSSFLKNIRVTQEFFNR